ncbi:hypothetical protein Vretifemale_1587, partial [Volvox reticuliferus]
LKAMAAAAVEAAAAGADGLLSTALHAPSTSRSAAAAATLESLERLRSMASMLDNKAVAPGVRNEEGADVGSWAAACGGSVAADTPIAVDAGVGRCRRRC